MFDELITGGAPSEAGWTKTITLQTHTHQDKKGNTVVGTLLGEWEGKKVYAADVFDTVAKLYSNAPKEGTDLLRAILLSTYAHCQRILRAKEAKAEAEKATEAKTPDNSRVHKAEQVVAAKK